MSESLARRSDSPPARRSAGRGRRRRVLGGNAARRALPGLVEIRVRMLPARAIPKNVTAAAVRSLQTWNKCETGDCEASTH